MSLHICNSFTLFAINDLNDHFCLSNFVPFYLTVFDYHNTWIDGLKMIDFSTVCQIGVIDSFIVSYLFIVNPIPSLSGLSSLLLDADTICRI